MKKTEKIACLKNAKLLFCIAFYTFYVT